MPERPCPTASRLIVIEPRQDGIHRATERHKFIAQERQMLPIGPAMRQWTQREDAQRISLHFIDWRDERGRLLKHGTTRAVEIICAHIPIFIWRRALAASVGDLFELKPLPLDRGNALTMRTRDCLA
jgi:hypothetical protein